MFSIYIKDTVAGVISFTNPSANDTRAMRVDAIEDCRRIQEEVDEDLQKKVGN